MTRIALTGGIACGKSLVSKYLNELGVETIDADDIVHELIPDEERRRLAKIVFNDEKARRELEAKIHPIVKARIRGWQDARRETRDASHQDVRHETLDITSSVSRLTSLRVAVAPLLFEARWDSEYDIICCVSSERATQVDRMMTTRGYSREEAEARLAAQMPVGEKAAKSHYVIENNGSQEDLRENVRRFVDWLKERVRH